MEKINGKIQNIVSNYILKTIFLLLDETKKLDLIIYNKYLQKRLNIDNEYYKNISGIIKYIQKDGKGKEYTLYTNILTFEGEYKNGKRTGKGKEYYTNGELKFEGEYLKGKKIKGIGYDNEGNITFKLKDGKGEEFFDNGLLQFEGDYLYGRRWNGIGNNYQGYKDFKIKTGNGIVKEYDFYGNIIFKGEYKNGKRNGKGEEYDNVIFVISKGWNQYQFETYAPMIKNGYPQDKEASYIRNRNLFYVCCSRPKKRLFFFISVSLDDTFRDFLSEIVGDENIMTYKKYISRNWRNG